MNEIQKEYDELQKAISMVQFQSSLDESDWRYIRASRARLKELEQLMPERVAMKLTGKDGQSFYLANDPLLCCDFKPYWFISIESAIKAFAAARLTDKEQYTITMEKGA